MRETNDELKATNYETFMLALSLLAIINLPLYLLTPDPIAHHLVQLVSAGLSIVFLGDFCYRLLSAYSSGTYFFRQYGWADLLSSIPVIGTGIFRVFRIWRTIKLRPRIGVGGWISTFLADRAGSALLTVLLLIILLLEFGSMGVIIAERGNAQANITTAGDALWWSYVTITTTGYGDRFPVTSLGRLIGIIMVTFGVILVGLITAFLANRFLRVRPVRSSYQAGDTGDMARRLAEIERLFAEQERITAELRARLVELHVLERKPEDDGDDDV